MKQLCPRYVLGATFFAALLPFLLVEIFPSGFYHVMSAERYLVFHNVAEFFSVMVSLSIFGVGWFSYDQSRDRRALFLSAAFLAVGLMDFMHTLGYTGMPPFWTPNSPNKSTQYWIAARFLTASAFLVSAFIASERQRCWLSKPILMTAALFVPLLVFSGVTFFPAHVPATFVEGAGLTPFKKGAEYVIICLLGLAIAAYGKRMAGADDGQIVYYLAAFVLCIFSELVFTVYKSVFDTFNILGHVYKVAAFYLIYKGIFASSVGNPYVKLADANEKLRMEIGGREKALEGLEAAGDYNRSLIEASMDPLVTIGPDGRITDVNAATETATGRQRKELIGTDFSDYFTEPGRARSGYEQVFREGMVRDYALEIRRSDGHITPVLYNAVVYRDEAGGVMGVFAAARDMTERKRAEEAIQHASTYNRRLIEASLDPLVTIGPEGTIQDVNAATESVTGRSRDELIGTDFSDYFTKPERARDGYKQAFREGTVRDYALEIRHRDGTETPVLYNASVYRDESGTVIGVFAAARDITEVRRAQRALEQFNRELEQRVEARTAELTAANRELEAFAYSVSHDLRAPLRAIDGFSRMMEEDYNKALDEEGKRVLGVIRSETRKMAQLIDDLLSFSRIGRRGMNAGEIDMEGLARTICEEARAAVADRKVEIRLGALPRAKGDSSMVRQVLVNLLSNAVKFTRPRETAIIEINGRVDGDEYVYSVKDNGVGFDMQYANKLFGVFQRLHAAEEFEGTGVGLAIVQRIIHKHGGRLWGEGAVDRGAVFYFTLPRSS